MDGWLRELLGVSREKSKSKFTLAGVSARPGYPLQTLPVHGQPIRGSTLMTDRNGSSPWNRPEIRFCVSLRSIVRSLKSPSLPVAETGGTGGYEADQSIAATGLKIHGYLSLLRGVEALRGLPTVLVVHTAGPQRDSGLRFRGPLLDNRATQSCKSTSVVRRDTATGLLGEQREWEGKC